MSAPLGRCQCARAGCDHENWPANVRCTRDAVRLVTVGFKGVSIHGSGELHRVPMCAPCSAHHEAKHAAR